MIRPIRHHRPASGISGLRIEAHGRTDIGQREMNQDQFLIAAVEQRVRIADSSVQPLTSVSRDSASLTHVFAVADGMGGQAGGDVASRLVIETIAARLADAGTATSASDGGRPGLQLPLLMEECQSAVRRYVEAHPGQRGMGTTLTLACVVGSQLHLAHAGDSRAYLIRADGIQQLTTDHTIAQQLHDAGEQPEESHSRRWEHVLWNVIGGDGRSLKPQFSEHALQEGDLLVLCTDGLMRGLSDSELARIILEDRPLDAVVEEAIEVSGRRDGRDNITLVAVRFQPAAQREPERRKRLNSRTDTWPSMPAASH